MVKVNITYICDKCKQERKEKTILHKGYDEVGYIVENKDSGYMPDGWGYFPDDNVLLCDKCTKEDNESNEYVVIA
jgi:hypothetical protein